MTKLAAMDDRRLAYLAAMGITAWERRSRVEARSDSQPTSQLAQDFADAPTPADVETPGRTTETAVIEPVGDPAGMDWPALQSAALACRACELHETRKNVVFGVGSQAAQLMFIGEAPGAEEDRQGEPFVGAAGQLLNAMLKAIGLAREQVFIANMLKCRPPGNRDPRPHEVVSCNGFLRRQISLVQPKLIVALGRVAAQHLLDTDSSLARMRGKVHDYAGTPMLATYHPAYLLRKPADKRKSWEDLKQIRTMLAD